MIRNMEEIASVLGEGFFYDNVSEVLTGSREHPPQKKTEYLTRAIGLIGDAIKYCELMCRTEKIPLSELRNRNGEWISNIYLRISKTLPEEEKTDEKTVLNTLKEHQKTLTNIRDKKEVSNEQKQTVINLFNNMRKETLSETSILMYG